MSGDRYGLTVADVSGKGLPAAMMAVMLQGAFDAVASGDPGLEDLFCTEAQNVARDFFGEARLKECLQGVRGIPAPEVCSRVVEAVERFAGLAPQADDLTIALARFMPKQVQ